MLRRLLCAFLVAFPALSPAQAQNAGSACEPVALVKLSEYVLDNRQKLPKLAAANFGSVSAYLKIRYGNLDAQAEEKLIRDVKLSGGKDADQLWAAYFISRRGYERMQKDFGVLLESKMFGGQSVSAMRAALLSKDRQIVLRQMARLPSPVRRRPMADAVMALMDQPDALKLEVAKSSERSGLIELAGGLYLSLADGSAAEEFLERQRKFSGLQLMIAEWYRMPALHGRPILPYRNFTIPWVELLRSQMSNTARIAAMTPEVDFLDRFAQATGRTKEASLAALRLMKSVDPGKWRDPHLRDEMWLAIYDALSEAIGDKGQLDAALFGILLPSMRHYDRDVRTALDWIVAARAVAPYAQRKSSKAPARPSTMSVDSTIMWRLWLETAKQLRSSAALDSFAADDLKASIAAELMFAAGNQRDLARLIAMLRPTPKSVQLAHDFAIRIDRTCAAHLSAAGEALFPSRPTVFKFEPLP